MTNISVSSLHCTTQYHPVSCNIAKLKENIQSVSHIGTLCLSFLSCLVTDMPFIYQLFTTDASLSLTTFQLFLHSASIYQSHIPCYLVACLTTQLNISIHTITTSANSDRRRTHVHSFLGKLQTRQTHGFLICHIR
jgi:magnesium-transporting ATPase (P-type)